VWKCKKVENGLYAKKVRETMDEGKK